MDDMMSIHFNRPLLQKESVKINFFKLKTQLQYHSVNCFAAAARWAIEKADTLAMMEEEVVERYNECLEVDLREISEEEVEMAETEGESDEAVFVIQESMGLVEEIDIGWTTDQEVNRVRRT
ncbi:hypothetical protein GEMRC1_012029 [Eukaryota sp. GEM-RC1]